MRKRIVAILLTIALLIGILPVGVAAADETVRAGVLSCRQINPVYENALTEEAKEAILAELDEIAAQEPEETDELQGYMSETEVVSALQSEMVNRASSASVQFYSSSQPSQTSLNDLIMQACAHDGVANHGDYIFWNMSGNGWSGSYDYSGGYYYITLTFQFSWNATASQETQVTDGVNNLIQSFAFNSGTPTAYKIKTIYSWICQNVAYDYYHLENDPSSYRIMYSAYGAIIDRTCVCQGYALLLYRLLLTVGIDSRIITSTDHAWNIVKLDNCYYYADSTWDAGSLYENWCYFLAGTESFDQTHYNEYHVREDGTSYGGYDYTYGSTFDQAHPMAQADYSMSVCECNDHTCQNVITREPTCTACGILTATCTVCGENYTDEIPKSAHTTTKVEAKAATCIEAGNSAYYICSACGKHFLDEACTNEIEENSWIIPASGHSWGEEWSSDSANHWHVCTACGEKKDEAEHVSSGPATEEAAETCTICDYVIAPALGHVHTNHLTPVAAKDATCTDAGNQAYYVCDCGMWFADADALQEIADHSSVVIPAKGHTPETVPGKAATCTEAGLTEGSKCSVCEGVLSAQMEIPALGHSFTTYVSDGNATCTSDGTKTATCDRCEETNTIIDEGSKLGHSLTLTEAKAPTCTEDGNSAYYTCDTCGKYFSDEAGTSEIAKDSWVIPAKGHQWSTEWTSDADGHWHTCAVCGEKIDQAVHTSSGAATEEKAETCTICDYVITPALGHVHSNHLTSVAAKAATCMEAGNQAYYVCDCGMWFADAAALNEITDHTSVVIPAKGHTPVTVPGKAATCTETGLTEGSKCSVCEEVLVAQTEIPAKGHSWDDGVVTTKATCKNEGVTTYTCTVCEATKTESIPMTDHDYVGKPPVAATCTTPGYTAEYVCRVCQHATGGEMIPALGHSFTNYVYNNDAKVGVDGTETATCDRDGCHETDTRTAVGTALPTPPVTFTDVPSGAYYAPAVNWAVANNITAGTTPTTFSPDDTCTRAQVVAFLWRAAGRPEPETSSNPFTDVNTSDYFYKAVLWASENGIVYGTSSTTFSPNQGCTRGQVAAFLWRAKGRPEPTTGNNPFTDVKASEYYTKAVIWAAENKIVYGTSSTRFSPEQSCTRAQIVTFLYRTYGK